MSRTFRPKPFFLIAPGVVMVFALGAVAYLSPMLLLVAVPFWMMMAYIGATANAGIILDDDGMRWFAVRRAWVFRTVPWSAIVKTRCGLFNNDTLFVGPIILTVQAGRYERQLWGTTDQTKVITLGIHPRYIQNRRELWPAIEEYRERYSAVTV